MDNQRYKLVLEKDCVYYITHKNYYDVDEYEEERSNS